MEDMYFWMTSGEDGTSIKPMTKKELMKQLDEEDGDCYDFLSEIPDEDKGCWQAPEGAVVILKGKIIVPRAVEKVTKLEID